jgi:Ser/Thr protein kinase RdoA (MazF antagonist)
MGYSTGPSTALPLAPIHDDYHRKNLLVVGDTITALLDWDGCHPDWLLLDMSVATWEFCLDKPAHTLYLPQAQAFVGAYVAAGGPVSEDELALVIPLMRLRRVIEILFDLQKAVTGDGWNADAAEYLVHNLVALENLAQLRLLD